jgi:YD repeat-containing protein
VASKPRSRNRSWRTVARSYTATGRLATETQTIRLPELPQPVENQVSYEYSPDGRLSVNTYPDESRVQHYHNARGELIEIIDTQPMAGLDANNARYTYTRRADGRITALTHPNGVTTTRDYDEVGRLAKIAHLDPSGKVLESEASTLRPTRLSFATLTTCQMASRMVTPLSRQSSEGSPAPEPTAAPICFATTPPAKSPPPPTDRTKWLRL